MREAMDRLWDNGLVGLYNIGLAAVGPDLDLIEKDDCSIVKAELPGFKPENVDIRVEGNVLTLNGEYDEDAEKQEEKYHVHERRRGNFTRTLGLPVHIKAENASAEFGNGVLTLILPKDETALPKSISIKATPAVTKK